MKRNTWSMNEEGNEMYLCTDIRDVPHCWNKLNSSSFERKNLLPVCENVIRR
jgi:hypothetical protein